MDLSPGNHALHDWIRERLAEGLTLTASDLNFIVNTCGLEPGEDLDKALEDPESWDAESVAALVFSADETTQIDLLPLIHEFRFSETDSDKVKAALEDAPVTVTVRFPEPDSPLNITAAPFALDRFVDSLHITRRVTSDIALAIDIHVPEDRRTLTTQRIRMAAVPSGEHERDTLVLFLQQLADDTDFFSMLALVLEILVDAKDPDQVYGHLAFRKRRLYRALQEAEKFERAREQHNMETLMMQGTRVPAMDADDARQQMNIIDRICFAMFGKTEVIMPEEVALSEDSFARDRD